MKKPFFFIAQILLCAVSCGPKNLEPVPPQPEPVVPDNPAKVTAFVIEAAANHLDSKIEFSVAQGNATISAKYLKWIEADQPAMMTPVVTHDGYRLFVGENELKSGVTAVDFSAPFTLKVVTKNGTETEYTVSLNCPQINKELPVLRLQPDSEINSKEVYVPTTATLYSPHTDKGWWMPEDGKIEVRGRGNSTWVLPKKPYRLKFPEKVSPVGLDHAKAKSWVLIANDMDKSLIRDALGWEMSRILFNPSEGYHDALALTFTPCTQFINVYMNNDYHGLYLMSDQMERASGRIEVDKLEAADGSNAEKIKGGHLIEVNIHGESAPVRFKSSKGIQMDHKYPKDDDYDPAQYSYIENYIRTAESALYGSNFKDKTNGWRKYFDEKTLADYIIIKELCGDMDGYTSCYFYKRRGSDKLFFGPIWDVDKGWDNDCRTAGYTSDKANSLMIRAGFQMPGCSGKDWFNRFWEDETLRSFVNQRWQQRREQLIQKVKECALSIPDAMPNAIEANYTKWKFYYQASTEANMPAKTYALEIQRIRDLTDKRAAVLDKLFAE